VLLSTLGPALAAILTAPAPGRAATWPADAIVVALPTDVGPVALFTDERQRVRERVAATLATKGHRVVPVAELVAIEDAALQGRLAMQGDLVCRAPLRRAEIEHRIWSEHPIARVSAQCSDGDCRLQVEIETQPSRPDVDAVYTSARVRSPARAKSWIAAADDLRPTTQWLGHIGGLSLSSHPPPIRFLPPTGIGPWAGPAPSEPFDALEPTAAGCAHPDPFVHVLHEIRASIDRAGRVQRCESTSASASARADDPGCLCGRIETLRFAAGRAGRRLRVDAEDLASRGVGLSAVTFTATWIEAQPDTEDWVDRLREAAVLQRCREVQTPSDFEATVTLALHDDGTIEDVHIGGVGRAPENMSFVACVADELRAVALPCRPPSHAELVVRMRVDVATTIDRLPLRR